MAATKTPQDHKQPKDKPRTITVMGATLTIDPAVFDDLDIMELLGGGIDLKFNATGTFNADISFDAYTLNTLIDALMDKIFGRDSILDLSQLAPDMFTQHHLRNIAWDRDGGMWDNLAQVVKDDIVPDLVASNTVKNAVGGIDLSFLLGLFGGTIDNVLSKVKPLITTLLPIPVMDTVNAGINFVDGTLANIYITGYDNGKAIVSADKQEYTRWTQRHSGNKLELWIYNQFASVGQDGNIVDGSDSGIVDWGEIPKTVVYEPYQYSDTNFNTYFVDYNFSGKNARFQQGTLVQKSAVSFTFASGQHAGQDVHEFLTNNKGYLDSIAANGGRNCPSVAKPSVSSIFPINGCAVLHAITKNVTQR